MVVKPKNNHYIIRNIFFSRKFDSHFTMSRVVKNAGVYSTVSLIYVHV